MAIDIADKHAVSVFLVDLLNQLGEGAVTKEHCLAVVAELDQRHVDKKQHQFFVVMRVMIKKVAAEATRTTIAS